MIGVSVVVPTYKRIDQTLKTLQLILASEGSISDFNLEVIVADCTPDESLHKAISKTFGDTILYKRTPKQGISTNKNQGARIAQYDTLIFCDSDIEVEPDTIVKTVVALQAAPRAAMIGGSVLWRGGERDGQIDRPEADDRRIVYKGTTYIEVLYSRYIATYKHILEKVGRYDEEVFNMRGEGADLSTRYWRAGYPLVYDAAIIVHHIFDAPDSAAIRIDNPEYAVARDFFLLSYKYSMIDKDYPHFQHTINNYFNRFSGEGPSAILKGLGKYWKQIESATATLNQFRKNDSPKYDLKFLEIFSDEEKVKECIDQADYCGLLEPSNPSIL